MWFTNGISQNGVMVLAGLSSFATAHKFYLVMADDLVHSARVAIAQDFRQKVVQNGAGVF